MKILVPIDGSELAEGMLVPAYRMAPEGELVLVRVVDPALDATEKQTAEVYLNGQRRLLKSKGTRVRCLFKEGDPAEQILAVVKEEAPDVVAMVTHGSGGNTKRVRGSVAEELLRSCPAPMFLCNPEGLWAAKTKPIARLLVTLDGSGLSDKILPHAIAFARLFSAEATILHVADKRFDVVALEESFGRQKRILEEAGVSASFLAIPGDPAEEILRVAADHHVVCLATHGRTGLSRLWFGSVAEHVLRVCSRPLLVIRSTAD